MTTEHSGAGDPERTLALLWRRRVEHTRGRKPGLTVDRIVHAAIAVADREGLEAMSMARVAAEAGVGTMTLYTYVPGKAELIDLMVDQVLLERGLEDIEAGPWRERIEGYAARTLEMHRRHRWLRQVSQVLRPFGPGLLAQQEFLLASVARTGAAPLEVVAAVSAIVTFVDSAVAAVVRAESAGPPDARSFGETGKLFWDKVFEPSRYPKMHEFWVSGGYDRTAADAAQAALDFGLARLLDGMDRDTEGK